MNDDEPGSQENVRSFLEHVASEEMAAYLQRGRRYAQLSDGDLRSAWAAAFRKFVAQAGGLLVELDDISAELRLRELPYPEELVATELAQLQRLVDGMDGLSEAGREEIREYFRRRDEGH